MEAARNQKPKKDKMDKEYEEFKTEAAKLVFEISAKYKWDPAYILEIAAMLAEDVNYHEVAESIRNA